MMTARFFIVNAFSDRLDGGNPAAVILLKRAHSTEVLWNTAKTLNQPVTTFLYPSKEDGVIDATSTTFTIRWLNTSGELPLCGHGTLAASGVIFAIPGLVANTVEVVNFCSPAGMRLTTRRCSKLVEISLPSTTALSPDPVEAERLRSIVKRGLGKHEINVKFVGTGGKGFKEYMLAEIDEKDDLAGCKADTAAFLDTGYSVNVITSSSSDPKVAFISRMFAPMNATPEDHVCGSAHCLLTPYWAERAGFGETTVWAKQVSRRGGDIQISWEKNTQHVTLGGKTRILMMGDIVL